MNLLNLLMSSMTADNSVNSLSKKTGISADQLIKLIRMALPVLMKYLTANAASPAGAQSLLGALMQHKSTRSMADQFDEADEQDGEKILGHILGSDSDQVLNGLAEKSELDRASVEHVLANMAPGLLSGVSAAKESASGAGSAQGFDVSGLLGMFGGTPAAKKSGIGGILSGIMGLGGADKEEENEEPGSGVDGSDLMGALFSLLK
ncbi:MAG: DUF937 domain-containing protein [Lachnospiraceae bacterium]|nr:DUF937 domain-containing protein [Lachnospiraceae bacterium]